MQNCGNDFIVAGIIFCIAKVANGAAKNAASPQQLFFKWPCDGCVRYRYRNLGTGNVHTNLSLNNIEISADLQPRIRTQS